MNKILYNGQVIIDLDELADKYTKAEVDALVSSVFKYKGTVATKADLDNIVDMKIGDCYNVEADGVNYAWNGEEWGALSGTVDLTNYYTKEQVDGKFGSYLPKNNTTEYTPTDDYNPATKKYVDDKMATDYEIIKMTASLTGPNTIANGNLIDAFKSNATDRANILNYINKYWNGSTLSKGLALQFGTVLVLLNMTGTGTGGSGSSAFKTISFVSNGVVTKDKPIFYIKFTVAYSGNTPGSYTEYYASTLIYWQGYASWASYLHKENTEAYTPTANYHPATKKYVDDSVKNANKYKLYRIDNSDELSTNDFSTVFMNWLNTNVVPNLTANPWDTVYIDVNASSTDYVSGVYRVEYDSSTGADYNLMFINVDNDNRFVGFIDSTPTITELFFSKSNKNVLELNGTYNDIDVTPGYDFSIDEVNALISKIDYTQSSININLERDFGTRVHSNKIIGCIGFNETTYTDETVATQEVSLSFITVSDGAYLRFYGSAALTNGAITSVLHCYSEDYNG